ncbi:hypothetical protein GJ629_00275 [Halapricum sp. CBA1109]|uniref:hypothetical protein n=1 Tax=Halapricum sp. CBA1109 TaxID=2668068 RepID=UPI0012F99807|nr:hypothetical protein [Halapricum sp. CBA1109]MUV88511.1 hypothetical protein [Halapricum sp. CBA1109]
MPDDVSERRAVRLTGAVVLVIGAALLVNVAFGFVEVGEQRYRYQAVDATPGETTLFPEDSPDHVDGIDCLDEESHLCALELSMLERQPRANESTPSVSVTVSASVGSSDVRFAFHKGEFYPFDGQYYERTHEDGQIALRPVSERAVFERIAVGTGSLSEPARRALSGPTTGERPLAAVGTVVRTDDGYVVLKSDRLDDGDPLLRWTAILLQFPVGATLSVRGWRSVRDPQISA